MSTVLQYRKIKVSSKDEAKMLDVLLSTSQQFKAISKDEYFITTKQCTLLTEKKYSISKTIMRLVKKVKLYYKLPKFHNDGTRISGKKVKKFLHI